MKRMALLSPVLLLFFLGCNKSEMAGSFPVEDSVSINAGIAENSITGKWTYTEYFYSNGGAGKWHNVLPANQTIEFKPDGSFIPADAFLKGATRFEIIDSVTIRFETTSTPSGFRLMGFKTNKSKKELYLYPVNPMCIEGCSSKFRR